MKTGSCGHCGDDFLVADRGRPRRYCSRSCQARAYRARRDAAHRPRATRPPVRRTELNRETIVQHAIDLADAEGLDALSMRAVAARGSVPVMSLYRHLSGKDELVAAMVDSVLRRHWTPPAQPGGWRSRLEHEARQEWQLYQRHPWVLGVLATPRAPMSPSVLSGVDRSMTTLTGEGLDPSTALSVYLMISGYVQGAALLPTAEAAAVRDSVVSSGTWWTKRLGNLAGAVDSGRYPWLTALAETPAARGPTDDDLRAWFEFGLQRVLDGVAIYLRDHGRARR